MVVTKDVTGHNFTKLFIGTITERVIFCLEIGRW